MEKKDMENAAILYDEIDRNKLLEGLSRLKTVLS